MVTNTLIGSMAIDMDALDACVWIFCGTFVVFGLMTVLAGLDLAFVSSRKERKIKRMKAKRQSCYSCAHRIVFDEIDKCELAKTEYWNVVTGESDIYYRICNSVVGEKQCKWKRV